MPSYFEPESISECGPCWPKRLWVTAGRPSSTLSCTMGNAFSHELLSAALSSRKRILRCRKTSRWTAIMRECNVPRECRQCAYRCHPSTAQNHKSPSHLASSTHASQKSRGMPVNDALRIFSVAPAETETLLGSYPIWIEPIYQTTFRKFPCPGGRKAYHCPQSGDATPIPPQRPRPVPLSFMGTSGGNF